MPLTSHCDTLRVNDHARNAGAPSTEVKTTERRTTMTLKDNIEAMSGDPAGLEGLYREVQAAGNEAAFREAVRKCREERPWDVLVEAWVHRLDVPADGETDFVGHDRNWWTLIGASVLLGVLSALLSRGKVPVPVPGEADLLFWVGWGPLVAVGLLAYLAYSRNSISVWTITGGAAAVVVAVAVYTGLTMGGRADDAAFLGAIHLLFVSWVAVGAALCLGVPNPSGQAYAFLVKSVEIVLTGGIFFGAGLIFVGLTYGIFAVVGVELPEEDLRLVAAWAVGAIPLLAIGSVYDASASPLAQDWHAGLTRTLRTLARLLLPLALGVLLVYTMWFIPVYFRQPFEEREVLIVYNATIMAVLVLLTVVTSGPLDAQLVGQRSLLRYGVHGLGGLTLILNVYALIAVVSRTLDSGLTPNRFAVIGWNVTTLLIVAFVGVRLWRARRQPWISVFRESIGLVSPLAAVWVVSLLAALPLFQ